MKTTLLTITKNPFVEWKTTERYITEAVRRGFPVLVYLDNGSHQETKRLRKLGATVRPFIGKGYPESALAAALAEIETEWVLWVSDDEMPGTALWKFAENPPAQRAFRVRMVSLLPDGAHYGYDQYQPRLFPLSGKPRIPVDAFETGLQFDVPEYDALDLVLWHHCNFAPREDRERKVARYIDLERPRGWPGYADVTRQLYLYEDYPVLHRPLAPQFARQLPNAEA